MGKKLAQGFQNQEWIKLGFKPRPFYKPEALTPYCVVSALG